MKKLYTAVFSILYLHVQLISQSTFEQVQQILQTNCAGSGCHVNGGHPSFNVLAPTSTLYSQLVNITPANPAAATKGDKIIKPGYVEKSYLLRKIAHNLNRPLSLNQPDEGSFMPLGTNALPIQEIELIRQWILYGAPQTGDVVDTGLINTFYRNGGIEDTYPNPPVPAAGTGFQMYVGKVFVKPLYETYYFIKHKPDFQGNVEIPKIETFMPRNTHHFVIYKFLPGASSAYSEGLRDTSEDSHSDVLDGIGTGAGYWEYQLPPNTAYFWDASTTLDFNLHIKNPSRDSILATDLYINVYTQPVGTAADYMLIRNFPVFTITIPQDSQEHVFTEVASDSAETNYWNIWQMYSHTHKYGTDYDIFLRNPDGSIGNQEYEGWYSYEQGFMVGYYRTGVDVTFKYYPDNQLLQVDPRLGFIHRAKFKNTDGPDPISWGMTSDEEMMVMGFQYIMGDPLPPLSVRDEIRSIRMSAFPNPTEDLINISYILEQSADVTVSMTNVIGETVQLSKQQDKPAGNHLDEIRFDQKPAPGIYQLHIQAGANSGSVRFVVQ